MRQIIQKAVCFIAAFLLSFGVYAQEIDEIPFLFDDDPPPVKSTTLSKTASAPLPVKTENKTTKPIKFNQPQSDQPNIGFNAEPLTELTVTTPPLPKVSIDLTNAPPPPELPPKPVNTRTQGIDILANSLWDATTPVYSPTKTSVRTLHDVRGFELEGFYLGMSPEEVFALIHENNYKVVSSKDAISKFRIGYYESLCKSKGIRMPEKIRSCISKMSKANDTTYLSTLKVSRPRTHETIEFSFSSPATDNRVWKIHYENKGDNSLNFTRANTRKKLDRQEAFLNALFNKFGTPDDPKNYIWGSEDDAFMRAGMYGSNYDAFITLTDMELSDDDLLEAKDWLEETKPFEHFGFED